MLKKQIFSSFNPYAFYNLKRVKGTSLEYFEKDVKQKYLKSMYLQVSEDNKIDINKAYHMKANTIKYDANKTIELIAKKGISIKCGANVLTVDTSGIHIKSGSSNTSSSNGKAGSLSVEQVEILKPLYNKLKVISLSASISKQDDIKDVLTFSAIVQKYENDAWIETKELSATQTAQMQWHFIKNNDLDDKDILSDNKIDDSISISGLEMSVNLSKTNIYKYAHVHCFVVDPKKEAYANSTLIRYLEVQDIKYDYPKKQEGECTAILNVDEPRSEELDQIRWNIENKEVEKYNGKEIIKHNIKEEKVYEINFKAYIKGIPEDASNATLTYDEKGKIKAKKDKENKEEKEKQEKAKENLALLKKKKEEKKAKEEEVKITVIVELPHTKETGWGAKGLAGHTAMAIGDRFFDYGPDYDATKIYDEEKYQADLNQDGDMEDKVKIDDIPNVGFKFAPGRPWWGENISLRNNKKATEITLAESIYFITKLPWKLYESRTSNGFLYTVAGTYIYGTVYTIEFYVPQSKADKMIDWWENRYKHLKIYSVKPWTGEQCTTTVKEALKEGGILSIDFNTLTPDGILEDFKTEVKSTSVQHKDEKAKVTLIKKEAENWKP